MCKWKAGWLLYKYICMFFALYSCRPQGVCTYMCVSCAHSYELCSLTKHLFSAHTRHRGAWWSSPNPPTCKGQCLLWCWPHRSPLLLYSIDSYGDEACSRGSGWLRLRSGSASPGFASEYKIQLTATYCSACWVQSEGHTGTYTRGMNAHAHWIDFKCAVDTRSQAMWDFGPY